MSKIKVACFFLGHGVYCEQAHTIEISTPGIAIISTKQGYSRQRHIRLAPSRLIFLFFFFSYTLQFVTNEGYYIALAIDVVYHS